MRRSLSLRIHIRTLKLPRTNLYMWLVSYNFFFFFLWYAVKNNWSKIRKCVILCEVLSCNFCCVIGLHHRITNARKCDYRFFTVEKRVNLSRRSTHQRYRIECFWCFQYPASQSGKCGGLKTILPLRTQRCILTNKFGRFQEGESLTKIKLPFELSSQTNDEIRLFFKVRDVTKAHKVHAVLSYSASVSVIMEEFLMREILFFPTS